MADLFRLSACEAVGLLKRGAVSPLEPIDASAARIAATDESLLVGTRPAGYPRRPAAGRSLSKSARLRSMPQR